MNLEHPANYEERRESIRAKRIVTVHHRLSKHKGRAAKSTWQVSMTENMSYTGLLFVSAIGYEAGDIVEVEVIMSGVLDIFKGFGKVIRQKKRKGGFFEIAIQYVDLKLKSNIKKDSPKSKLKK